MLKTNVDRIGNNESERNCCWPYVVEEMFEWEYDHFLQVYVPALRNLYHLQLVLIAFGLLGNLLALLTLTCSKKMRSPSFLYHKALIVANLIFCVNYTCVQGVDRRYGNDSDGASFGVNEQFVFQTYIAAYYSGVLKSVIASACGYMANYMCLLISLDRFSGMILYRCYLRFNNRAVAWRLITLCTLLSVVVHSWAAWIETSVVEIVLMTKTGALNASSGSLVPSESPEVCCYTWVRNVDYSPLVAGLIQTKDVLNLITRLICALLLTVFTVGTLYSYIARAKRRKRFRLAVNGRKASTHRSRTKSLFILMTVAVVLFYTEDLPREAKRLLQLIYPLNRVVDRMSDRALSMDERLHSFRLMLYLHQYSQLWLNLFAVVNHSLHFYCNLALNNVFRKESWKTITHCRVSFATLTKSRRMSQNLADSVDNWGTSIT
uniref:G_PROTEIN_RECEP_F1_2 domain-containing protein n=1 Tax=Trichuris muris TaxID=70415 RepID=A0A5S6QY89_TRIMR